MLKELLRTRTRLISLLLALALIGAIIISIISALPPRTFTILTGSDQGEYYRTAQKYAEIAAAKGFTLNIRTTAGSLETLQILTAGEAHIGFVQGGLANDADSTRLSTVASIFREPIWIFYRKSLADEKGPLRDLTQLQNLRIAIGAHGSGTQPLALELLASNGVHAENATLLPLSSSAGADGLLDGSVDLMFMVVGPRSVLVQKLMRSPDIELMSLDRADAYRSHFAYLSSITLPAGAIDLQADIPATNKKMITTVANLVMRNDFHPDLLRLIVVASLETHRHGGFFEIRDEFPNLNYPDLPIKQEVRTYITRLRNGESTLDDYLPFWAAAMVDRYLLFVLPAVLVILPILGRSPLLYNLFMRRRVTRWYRDVRQIDRTVKTMALADVIEKTEFLDNLEDQINKELNVSEAFMPDVYNLKMHLNMVQERLRHRETDLTASK
ncbi:hypothetical protein KFU94_20675 [Chloroflexi bacterium TSY]|nr:hypothetical protein [Chloroflexi bacterium TSY]